jgi:uncharacterized metal-binding protein
VQLTAISETIQRQATDAIILVLEQADAAPALLAELHERFSGLVAARANVLFVGAGSAALAQLTRSLAAELGPHGLRANALALGIGCDVEAAKDAGLFLLSDEASYVTGIMLPVR